MLHLQSGLSPKVTNCDVDVWSVITTQDSDFFIEIGNDNLSDICVSCAENGLHEEDSERLLGA